MYSPVTFLLIGISQGSILDTEGRVQTGSGAEELANLWAVSSGYDDLGTGKCVLQDGSEVKEEPGDWNSGRGNDCEKLCNAKQQCGGYSVSSNDHCLLYSAPQANLKVDLKMNWGNSHCMVKAGCRRVHVEFHGNDIGNRSIAENWQKCGRRCAKYDKCIAWTWDTRDRNCMLKDGTDDERGSDSTISGPKNCPGACRLEHGIDYYGNDLKGGQFRVTRWEECASKCEQLDGCVFWTWAGDHNGCYLKTDDKDRRSSVSHVSGSKGCSPRPVVHRCSIVVNPVEEMRDYSSVFNGNREYYGRSMLNSSRAWSPNSARGGYMQLDLGKVMPVHGTVVQGCHDTRERVKQYQVEYSVDKSRWFSISDTFQGAPGHTSIRNHFSSIRARYVRLHVTGGIWMRAGVLACPDYCAGRPNSNLQFDAEALIDLWWETADTISCQRVCENHKECRFWKWHDAGKDKPSGYCILAKNATREYTDERVTAGGPCEAPPATTTTSPITATTTITTTATSTTAAPPATTTTSPITATTTITTTITSTTAVAPATVGPTTAAATQSAAVNTSPTTLLRGTRAAAATTAPTTLHPVARGMTTNADISFIVKMIEAFPERNNAALQEPFAIHVALFIYTMY